MCPEKSGGVHVMHCLQHVTLSVYDVIFVDVTFDSWLLKDIGFSFTFSLRWSQADSLNELYFDVTHFIISDLFIKIIFHS